MDLKDRLVFACDAPSVRIGGNFSEADDFVAIMGGKVGWIKLNAAFVGGGHKLAHNVSQKGSRLWMDLKWHDVPDTIKNYVREAVDLYLLGINVSMFNVHASGGPKMMKGAKDKLNELFPSQGIDFSPKVIAITVPTSMDENEFKKLGFTCTIAEQVMRLARLTKDSGLDGVVASPLEAKMLRRAFGPDFLIVTPGIRFAEEAKGGQVRATTPKEAIVNGADMIVMGTSLIKGGLDAVERAYAEIEEGLKERTHKE